MSYQDRLRDAIAANPNIPESVVRQALDQDWEEPAMRMADRADGCATGYDLQMLIRDECRRYHLQKRDIYDRWHADRSDLQVAIDAARGQVRQLERELESARESFNTDLALAKQAHNHALKIMDQKWDRIKADRGEVGRNDFNEAVHTIRRFLSQADRTGITVGWGRDTMVSIDFKPRTDECEDLPESGGGGGIADQSTESITE